MGRTFKWIEWNIDKVDAHALTVRGKSRPWPFSTWATPKKAEVFWGCQSPHPAAEDFVHGLLNPADVESAFDRVFSLHQRRDGSFQMDAETPNGRRIWVIWRYDRDAAIETDVFDEFTAPAIFVITAY